MRRCQSTPLLFFCLCFSFYHFLLSNILCISLTCFVIFVFSVQCELHGNKNRLLFCSLLCLPASNSAGYIVLDKFLLNEWMNSRKVCMNTYLYLCAKFFNLSNLLRIVDQFLCTKHWDRVVNKYFFNCSFSDGYLPCTVIGKWWARRYSNKENRDQKGLLEEVIQKMSRN